jgi:hypothetical protein
MPRGVFFVAITIASIGNASAAVERLSEKELQDLLGLAVHSLQTLLLAEKVRDPPHPMKIGFAS